MVLGSIWLMDYEFPFKTATRLGCFLHERETDETLFRSFENLIPEAIVNTGDLALGA